MSDSDLLRRIQELKKQSDELEKEIDRLVMISCTGYLCEVCKKKLSEPEIDYRVNHGIDLIRDCICDKCWEEEYEKKAKLNPLGRICYVCKKELYAEDNPVKCEDCGTMVHTGCSTVVDNGDTIVCLDCLEKGATYAD